MSKILCRAVSRLFPLVLRMSGLGRWAPSNAAMMMMTMMPLLRNFHPLYMPKTGSVSGAALKLIPAIIWHGLETFPKISKSYSAIHPLVCSVCGRIVLYDFDIFGNVSMTCHITVGTDLSAAPDTKPIFAMCNERVKEMFWYSCSLKDSDLLQGTARAVGSYSIGPPAWGNILKLKNLVMYCMNSAVRLAYCPLSISFLKEHPWWLWWHFAGLKDRVSFSPLLTRTGDGISWH